MLTRKIKTELENLGIKPNKTLGQNFLVNEGIYKKILDIAQIGPNEIILEIGAGLGTLTEYLAKTTQKVVTIEKDRHLITYLREYFKNYKNVEIIEADILKVTPSKFGFESGKYKIIGNIPYYLTSHLIKIAAENWPLPKIIVFMVQKEVAQRITAKPPHMSFLGIITQLYFKAEMATRVFKKNFYPVPRVDSAIIKLVPKDLPRLSKNEAEIIFKVASAGFSEKRKQLINALSSGLKLPKKEIEFFMLSSDISAQRRAETLTLEEWQKLANTIYSRH